MALFQALREELLLAVQKNLLRKPVLVGVITPYREQVTCIRQTLLSLLGPELAAEVTLKYWLLPFLFLTIEDTSCCFTTDLLHRLILQNFKKYLANCSPWAVDLDHVYKFV